MTDASERERVARWLWNVIFPEGVWGSASFPGQREKDIDSKIIYQLADAHLAALDAERERVRACIVDGLNARAESFGRDAQREPNGAIKERLEWISAGFRDSAVIVQALKLPPLRVGTERV